MTERIHIMEGCSPEPLSNYLKALGLLRLLSEQADPRVRGWWQGEQFCLLTSLSRESLETFFLDRYEPTPLLSPWNKGSGFFSSRDPWLAPLEESQSPRLQRFRDGVRQARELLDAIAAADAAVRAIKARTKTDRTFQTDAQREVLKSSVAFRQCVGQLEEQLRKPDMAIDVRRVVEAELGIVRSLVGIANRRPTKAEVEVLKKHAGYKRALGTADREFKRVKATIVPDCRKLWRGPHAEWLRAAVVLDELGAPEWPSLLGTGGNDGRLDFTNNFMQQINALFEVDTEVGAARAGAPELLRGSIWGEPADHLVGAAIGQYQPAAAGGANSTTGFGSGSLVNPWDFVLMMEGAMLVSSSATRRLDDSVNSRASVPFAVRSRSAGVATVGSEKAQRGEQWMPIWKQPAALSEVAGLFGEGRIQVGRSTARVAVDVARAISRLGIARGVEAFARYGYIERNGQSTLAVPLGRVQVRYNPLTYLVDDIAAWLERLERRSRDEHAPARLVAAVRRLADTVFGALTHDYSAARWQAILTASAEVEGLQATGTALEAGPIPSLQPEWVHAADDGSVEVRLALALGSAAANYTVERRAIDSVRHHCLPLKSGAARFDTVDGRLVATPRAVVFGRDTIADLAAIVERRIVEASSRGQRRLPLAAAIGCDAGLDDLAIFLTGSVDLNKLFCLARAFMAIRWDDWTAEHRILTRRSGELPEETWLAVRLACLPWPLTGDVDVPADLRIVRRLIAGDSAGAVHVAIGRLQANGIRVPLQAGVTDSRSARIWSAALAFPISHRSAMRAAATLDLSLKGAFHV